MQNKNDTSTHIKVRKLSGEKYEDKFNRAKDRRIDSIEKAKAQYSKDLSGSEINQKEAKRKYKQRIKVIRNKYALEYNSLNNQKLHRRQKMESEIDALKSKKNHDHKFRSLPKAERKELIKKAVAKITKKYSTPLSKHYLDKKNRKNELDVKFVKVPFKTPKRQLFESLFTLSIAALITALALDVFVKPFGIYNAGLRGITQSIFYGLKHYFPGISTSISYALFFGANIPLIIFGYIKLGKKITLLTIFFMVVQYLFSFAIDISGLEDKIMPFGMQGDTIYDKINDGTASEVYKYALPFIGATIGGVVFGIGVGLIYRAGGTTGGSKFVVTWLSAKKNKSVGSIAKIIAIFVVTFGIMLNHVIIDGHGIVSAYTSTTLFASVVFIIGSNRTLDAIFAKSSSVKITTITTKRSQIERFLDLYLMPEYKFTVNQVAIGRNKTVGFKIDVIVPSNNADTIQNIFTQIDPKAKISQTKLSSVKGNNYQTWYE